MKISVIIPVYKNKELFLRFLKHNYQYIKSHEVIVVDDYSESNLKDAVMSISNKIIVIENEKNLGYAVSVNNGVNNSTGELILLLNSDVKLLDNSFETVTDRFTKDSALFACSFMQIEKNDDKVGKNVIYFQKGMIMHRKAKVMESGITAWAEGGSSVIRKKYFTTLGGFDLLYSPFYWEDIDLSYRAYKSGWHVQFTGSVVVEHHHESTIKKYYQDNKIRIIAYKNQFIFIWKNINNPTLLLKHLCLLPYNLFYYGIWKHDREFIIGLMFAIIKLPQVMKARQKTYNSVKVSDNEILIKFKAV